MSKAGHNAGNFLPGSSRRKEAPTSAECGAGNAQERRWSLVTSAATILLNPSRHALIVSLLWVIFQGTAFPAELKRDECVIVFPAVASRTAESNQWTADLHVWVGELEARGLSLAALQNALGLATDLSVEETAVFNERARWFLADNERRKEVSLRVGKETVTIGPTEANGHARLNLRFAGPAVANGREPAPGDDRLELTLAAGNPNRVLSGELFLVEPTGLSVISDIDDTIKLTEVRDREAMLRNTFLRPFRPAPGMSALYARWRTNDHAQFHYVSASPWQLYPALAEFRRTNGFPAGTFHLKTLRVKDETFLDLFQSPVEYKLGVIEPLLAKFPQRRFILVGDSGEADPEVYGEVARRHPEQIERILIREVTGEDENAERYQTAFREVAREKWRIFREPSKIPDR